MFKRLLVPLFVLLLGIAFFTWTLRSPFWQSLQQISGIMRLVHKEYVDPEKVAYPQLAESAIQGMLTSLDPYSRYMNSREYHRFQIGNEPRYQGVGIEIERLEDRVTITRVFPGGPAEKAGVLPGDQILEVREENTETSSTGDVSDMIREAGEEPFSVKLYRPVESLTLEVTLTREAVFAPSVQDVVIDDQGIGFFRITQFTRSTPEEFIETYREFQSLGMNGLIVDLRGNPGGLLDSAKSVAGSLMAPGELVCYIEGREVEDREEFLSEGQLYRPGKGIPVVVLINERSASGSEIVAGAWQDSGIAKVLGETSHGKGSVQSVYRLKDGRGLRQTTALYYLPSGRSINEVGVQPDQTISMSMEVYDKLRLQVRHEAFMDKVKFEELFSFEPNIVDTQRLAAEQYLREKNRFPEAV